MATKKKQTKRAEIVPNPTIPDVAIEVDGRSFRLCFDFQALAIAKAKMKAVGVYVNILKALDFREVDVDTLPALFFAAALRFQPDLSWENANKLITMQTCTGIFGGLAVAYRMAMVGNTANPPGAAAAS